MIGIGELRLFDPQQITSVRKGLAGFGELGLVDQEESYLVEEAQ